MISTVSFSLHTEIPPSLQAFLPEEQRELVEDSIRLLEFHEKNSSVRYSDYSFIIFPLAKSYEGFLKLFFFQLGIVNKEAYFGRHFRIGRSFNPDLVYHLRDKTWLYDDVVRVCGEEAAREMWSIWLEGRNHLFHFFPKEKHKVSLVEAKILLRRFLSVMTFAVESMSA